MSKDGVGADPSKLRAIQEWPQPRNVKELRGFLGLTGYYRKFIPGYGKVCQRLYNLTKKEGFVWTDSATEAFTQLKSIMSSPQVLALPDFSQTFVVECDASGKGIGAVLQQNQRPIAFFSQALGPKNQALSTYERELIAIVHAVRKWQNYLQGRHFVIKTDHSSLKYFLGQRTNTQFQQKWVAKLLGFDYEIQYRSGNENTVADSLSRIPDHHEISAADTMALAAISYPYFGWMDDLRRYNENDAWIMDKIKEVTEYKLKGTTHPALAKYSVDNGFLCYKKRVVLSPDSQWRNKLMEEHHCTPTAGHQGVAKTYQRTKKGFYWQGMKGDIRKFIAECAICQQNKFETIAPPGLLQPLPLPQRVWSDISMDFIVGLPNCKGKSVIMVIVDRLSKYSHFIALDPTMLL